MAKSIRSKHRRKMRNVKRQSFAKKDLEKLKKVVSHLSKAGDLVTLKTDVPMKSTDVDTEGPTMEVDALKSAYDKKTKRDENGHYPEWMNQRAIKKHKAKLTKSKKKVGKKIKW